MKNAVCTVAVLLMFVSLPLLDGGPAFASTDDPNFIARNLYPADGETNVSVEPSLTLSWEIGDINTTEYDIVYDVYFGTDQDAVETSTIPTFMMIEATTCTLTDLEHDTEYFWRIDTTIQLYGPPFSKATITGNVWRFKTMPKKAWDPDPPDGKQNVNADPNVALTWRLGDIDERVFYIPATRYYVFYGTDFAEVREGWMPDFTVHEVTTLEVGPLLPQTTYYWRIDTGLASPYPPFVIHRIEGDVWSFTTATAPPRVITVDDDGPADFSNIQAAIDDSNDGDTVLVADGTYTGDGNRDIDFHGKAITVKSDNGPENCIIDCNASEHYKNRHRGFRFHSGEGADSVLDGFSITNGRAPMELELYPPWGSYYVGGGIYCRLSSPTVSNCIIRDNGGGGCGGLASEYPGSSPMVINCTFSGNKYSGLYSNYRGSFPKIAGCTFSGNEGGGIRSRSGKISLSNCILWGNGPVEIVLMNEESSATARYCDIRGGWEGIGNIDSDPCFADPNNADYHLKSQAGRWDSNEARWTTDEVTSPCIDAGDPMSPVGLEPFPNGGIINMGAYGGTAEASKSYFGKPPCETVIAGDVNGDCAIYFKDFFFVALHWLESH